MPRDNTSFRAQVPAFPAEGLPDVNPSSSSTGILVDDDFKTHIAGYWRYYQKPFGPGGSADYDWPDLAWRWTKHNSGGNVWGSRYPGGDGISAEKYATDQGIFWRPIPQFSFRSGPSAIGYDSFPALGNVNFGVPNGSFTAYIKFIWGGWGAGTTDGHGHANVSYPPSSPSWTDGLDYGGGGQGMAGTIGFNVSAGAWAMQILSDPAHPFVPQLGGVRQQDHGLLSLSLYYGYYDPGPGDSYLLGLGFTYPLTSVKYPDEAYFNQNLPSDNGNEGKYTLVITSDGGLTAYGIIHGHNGGTPEYFAYVNPFLFDNGPGNGSHMVPAITYYPPPQRWGYVDSGGGLGSTYGTWCGWLREYSISTFPFDTVSGTLGNLIPTRGYTHLDSVRFRSSG